MLQLWFVANTLLWSLSVQISGLTLGLNVVLMFFVGIAWIVRNRRISGYSAKVFFGLIAFMLVSYLVTITGLCTDKGLKIAVSSPVFVFLAVIGSEIGWRASTDDWLRLQKAAVWVLVLAFASFVVEMLVPGSFGKPLRYEPVPAYSGVFSEQSHVAFSLFSSIAILLSAESKQMRRIGMLALVGLFLFSRSSTLIGLTLAWGLYRLVIQGKHRWSAYYGLGLLLLLTVAAMMDYELFLAPTIDRVVNVAMLGDASNISSLVYLQGWQDAWANLQRTNGLGLGFNMMGCTPLPDVPAREIIASGFDLELNNEDGSILFGKFVSEAGMIGILVFLAIVWWWIRIEKEIRKCSLGKEGPAISIQTTLIFSFVATSLIRSTGYFSGGALLLVVAVAAIARWHKHRAVKIPLRIRNDAQAGHGDAFKF